MRKALTLVATGVATALALTACGGSDSASSSVDSLDPANPVTLTVGASPTPHARILEFVRDNLAEDTGLELEIQEFDDYVTPNISLNDGDSDVNFYQHLPYLESQMESQGYEFEHGAGIHVEPYAAFSEKHEDVSTIKEGARVMVTNDPSNQARALKMLEEAGLVKDIADDSSVLTLTEEQNPKDLDFQENQPELLVNDLSDPTVDLAIINGNYILEAGLNTDDALLVESAEDNPYANFLVWKTGNKDARIDKLEELLHSPETKAFIEETWPNGDVTAAF
ncbi:MULTISPECIES: MetQ/NlpA family ABC transporter substrate-binding protein [Arthrobacter]|uniref:Lipoprotein n=1 Tax=Arthrobacter jinronghuae TaxID=2964609 RepID=A0ABT1NNY3_9MICC|nr:MULTISPECIES: MetQ/NlpA family ABC transporter substrate-binding protein [Arthrobacter]MCQ1949431.1 MetQ/NlpA family ABC transporter substrate-binding protein [Arthrobacter jinronghuae]MCQ1952751.1 MetQ/NlpA family ABC transporter substrate-binding protein [Arthrobacter sp. zg-Y238]MCQ1955128.1 MetQ/NlpA family ABC transporter substrate-binding protein [Arthrobacter jinronghuae]UWX77794.1 MetQ/NlpA family ABC transporter substrate-binding protein [Arthrobacter jinronghuae]